MTIKKTTCSDESDNERKLMVYWLLFQVPTVLVDHHDYTIAPHK